MVTYRFIAAAGKSAHYEIAMYWNVRESVLFAISTLNGSFQYAKSNNIDGGTVVVLCCASR